MLQLFKCATCSKMVLVVQDGDGELACHQRPMIRLEEKSTDVGKEKHLPVIEKIPGGIRVKVGAVPHPMEPAHFIKWIEVIGDTFLHTQTLSPGDKPEREFILPGKDPLAHVQKVRIYCNVHGAWSTKP